MSHWFKNKVVLWSLAVAGALLFAFVWLSNWNKGGAEGTDKATSFSGLDFGFHLLVNLAVVVAIIVGLAWALGKLKQRGGGKFFRQRQMSVVEYVSLGSNRGLYLVSVGPTMLVVGATSQQLTRLMEFAPAGDGATAEKKSPEDKFVQEGNRP